MGNSKYIIIVGFVLIILGIFTFFKTSKSIKENLISNTNTSVNSFNNIIIDFDSDENI